MSNTSVNLNITAESAFLSPLTGSSLFLQLLLSLTRQKNSPDTSSTFKTEYDYIVVGAGSAGSVVAARLSEMPCVTVLLLEAGGRPPIVTDVPGILTTFWTSPISWNYYTTPQKHTGRVQINRQIHFPAGKVLGGSSTINAEVFSRGNRKDYDGWALMGATGWSYKEVLPYFKKLEDNQDPAFVANGFHGVDGPVTIMQPEFEAAIKSPIFRAAKRMGYKVVDPNARNQTGFYDTQFNQRNGQRCSAAKAYLVPVENRTNLDIVVNAHVNKILIKNERAIGVLFDFDGEKHEVKAKREVILSAGAINTPQLLMLSGIGPEEELRKFKIPVIADLPVGKNFQDHCGVTIPFVLGPDIRELTVQFGDPVNIQQYIDNRTGPLSSPPLSAVAFLLNDEINPIIDFPNYQIYFGEATIFGYQQILNMEPEVFQQIYGPYVNQSVMYCYVSNLHPRSVGTIRLNSTNPYDLPVVDPNFLHDERDLEDIVEGMKACIRIGNSTELREVGSRIFDTLYPGCEEYAHDQDEFFRCYARSELVTYSHYSGTAKMGSLIERSTVVDPELRVKDIRGLRVVDNSIMPKVISGNTNIPAMMIGEKAADMIKDSIKCKHDD